MDTVKYYQTILNRQRRLKRISKQFPRPQYDFFGFESDPKVELQIIKDCGMASNENSQADYDCYEVLKRGART